MVTTFLKLDPRLATQTPQLPSTTVMTGWLSQTCRRRICPYLPTTMSAPPSSYLTTTIIISADLRVILPSSGQLPLSAGIQEGLEQEKVHFASLSHRILPWHHLYVQHHKTVFQFWILSRRGNELYLNFRPLATSPMVLHRNSETNQLNQVVT